MAIINRGGYQLQEKALQHQQHHSRKIWQTSPIPSSNPEEKMIYSITRFVYLSEEPVGMHVPNMAMTKGSSVSRWLGKESQWLVKDPQIMCM